MTDIPRTGRIGVWTSALGFVPPGQARDVAAELEQLGYGTLWLSEGLVRDPFLDAALALESTSTLTLATGIASIWARRPQVVAGLADGLAEAYPGRFLLGLGTSHKFGVETFLGTAYGKPYTAMRTYLDDLDGVRDTVKSVLPAFAPREDAPRAPRVLAALGPKMLELARDRSQGAHPYLVTPEHTRTARDVLGPDRLLAVEQAVVLDPDESEARRLAAVHVNAYVGGDVYRGSLRRLGFTDDDFTGGPSGGASDRLVDALVAYGDADDIRRRLDEHFAAGADHVCIQALGDDPRVIPLAQWRALAPAA
ncbi:LLM class F420-dependent oxidoreductase [Spongiactinospora rosea]|uniref:LLM class F420-dependent oxidoreductase n=1 Tax=Spongiactinospora rosea TaxID=2248750 RepID=A0A366LVK0_9ACTN|nr:LLM class F420-dependent oxidoreductase [Spongiactinospora rosea]RBQ17975.1 LLM class F420-dependent oxidoreductase [Spongiactinospora rosea]